MDIMNSPHGLVLTRRVKQSIVIETPMGAMRIFVSHWNEKQRQVKLVFDCPKEFKIIREELYFKDTPRREVVDED